MARSKESSKRKRSSGSKDSGYYAKRHTANTNYRVSNFRKEENSTPSTAFGLTQSFCDVPNHSQIPYFSWTTYFFNQEYNPNSLVVTRINACIEFFERNTLESEVYNLETNLNLNVNHWFMDYTILQKWPSIKADMNINPQQTFNCIRVAFFEVLLRILHRSTVYQIATFTKIFRILRLTRINIINHESINALPYLKLSSYGRLTSISGVVINTGVPKLISAFVVLGCTCKYEIIVAQEHEKYYVPKKCKVCGNGKFGRLLNSPYQFTKVEQTIQIKDYRSTDQKINDGASSLNIISVTLSGTLVDKFVPGDKIRVIGIPRLTLDAVKSTTPDSCPLYIDSISTFATDDGAYGLNNEDLTTTPFDRNIIERIRSEPDVFALLAKSLCPSVQGHENIKAALTLGLFSGSFGCGETRDYIHTLIVGDLGLGKSQLLRAYAQISSKGVYVRGSTMKSVEPTLINVRAAGIEDSRLEAGAFALANQGVCCIDELDKISAQHQAIHTCMEDRHVNITNSEIKMDLEAGTAVIGMISPIKKRYDLSKTLVENVNVSQDLLSRFDLIFVMRDYSDTYRDPLMCDRVLNAHTKRSQLIDRSQFSGSSIVSNSRTKVSRSFMERHLTPDDSTSDILPQTFFRMYVNYARMYVKPEILNGSIAVIERFCSQRYQTDKDLMNMERVVRTLIIMVQARAKIDLRAEITDADIYYIFEIMGDTRSIQSKVRQVDRSLSSSSSNSNKLTANKVNQFLDDLRTEARLLGKKTFTTDELQNIAGKENVAGHIVSNLLSKLNEQGYILKVSSNMYKLVSE